MNSKAVDTHDGRREGDLNADVTSGASPNVGLESGNFRARSPTPPRALYRSTTGKGVAFTSEDITFLTRFMEYRRREKTLNKLEIVTDGIFASDRRIDYRIWSHSGKRWPLRLIPGSL